MDKPVTIDDLYILAHDDAVLYQAIALYHTGALTLEQMLLRYALVSTKIRKEQEQRIVDLLARLPPEPHRFIR